MTQLDDQLLPEVKAIIDEFGKSVVFEELTLSEYDPTTGAATEGGPNTYTVVVTPPDKVKQYLVNGETIQVGDSVIMMPAQDAEFTPVVDQAVTIDTVDFKVVKVEPIYSGDLIAVWTIFLRR